MALYYHVAGKEQILDGIVDTVFEQIEPPAVGGDWRAEMRRRAHSARAVLRMHPWAVVVLESRRSPGPATLRHHDAVIGCLRAGGFSIPLVAHAVAILDAFTYGFALEEVMLPFDSPDEVPALAESVLDAIPSGGFPNFVEFARAHALQPGYDFGDEFAWGLELILDGIAAASRREAATPKDRVLEAHPTRNPGPAGPP
jgi:AcrR family transcriptional regulator